MILGHAQPLLLAAVLLGVACSSVTQVERVIIVNETEYPADVSVGGGGDGWVNLANVPTEDSREIRQVIDQGELWTFRFSYGGSDPVTLELRRAELVEADWKVEVPRELEVRLRAKGVVSPP